MRTLYFRPVVSSSFFFRPVSAVTDWMSTIHDVALVRIQNACLKCAACGSLKIQDAKKSLSGHHRTTLSGYIFTTKACIDNWKNLLNGNISHTCPHNMVNFDPLTADIC